MAIFITKTRKLVAQSIALSCQAMQRVDGFDGERAIALDVVLEIGDTLARQHIIVRGVFDTRSRESLMFTGRLRPASTS